MNAPEHHKRNRRLGLVLCLLFAGLFAIVTAAIVTGSKAPESVESAVSGSIVPVLGTIGLLLIITAIGEIAQNRRLTVILSLLWVLVFVINIFVKGFTFAILSVTVLVTLLLLINAAASEAIVQGVIRRLRK